MERRKSQEGGKKYMLLICDDYSRFTRVYFLRSKSEVVVYFKKFLSDVRATGTPSTVEIVRSDEGGNSVKKTFQRCVGIAILDRNLPQQIAQSLTVMRSVASQC